jgi:transposase-like protein
MAHPLNPLFRSPIARLGPRPDDPQAIVGPRPKRSRRPHTDATFAAVRRLIEQTTLTYGEIAQRTGVGRASICRWTRDQAWQRPAFAPRATDTVPRARASAKLRRRTLAARLTALAERYVRELEETPGTDLDKLGEALELVKMAKLAAMSRRRRRNASAVPGERLRPMAELCAADVDLHRAPRAAIDDFLANRAPPREDAAPRGRSKRNARHAWMLENEKTG